MYGYSCPAVTHRNLAPRKNAIPENLQRLMKPTQTDKDAILRRAIIRVWPDCFSWPEARRERYQLQRSREDDFRLRQAVVLSLFARKVRSEEELEALLESFDDARYLLLNSTMLPLQGIGADSFFLNESLPDLKEYVERNGFDWYYSVVSQDVAREISQLYGDQFLNPPSTPMLIIDRHGQAHPLPFGIKSAAELLDALQPYLDESM